jgi:hypothetical protein
MQRITIIINQRPHHLDSPLLLPEDFRRLSGSPGDYEIWRIVHAPDPEGQLPIDDIQVTGQLTVESGWRFRVVPPGTFGAFP